MRQTGLGWLARLGAGACLLSGGLALGQAATTVIVPQGPLLPQKIGAWELEPTAPGCVDCYRGEGDQQAVLQEDGLRRGAHLTYHKPGAAHGLDLRALQFDDATGAVSAFTYLRTPEMRIVSAGDRVGKDEATSGNRYLFREGASVVEADLSSPEPSIAADLRLLAQTLPKISGPKGASPLLPTLLPTEDLVPGSIRYSVGPAGYKAMGGTLPPSILGFEKSAEAVTAEYAQHGNKGLLTLLLFPTPEIAGDRGRAIEASLNAAGEHATTAKLRREGPMLILARGGFTPAEAQGIVDRVHLRQEVTWNKPVPPEFHTEVRKTASLLTSIAVLSGVLGLAAVMLGLFLGLGRAWIRVLMGKPAATEPEFLRLDLSERPDTRATGSV